MTVKEISKMSEEAALDYEKCILWPITISDYQATMGYKHAEDGQPIAKLSIFTTKYDKIRIIG